MIVLIVGPSGVGKTTSYKAAKSHFPDVVFHDLDGLAARLALQRGIIDRECVKLLDRTMNNAESFLSIGLLAIAEVAGKNAGKHVVIDVGAGFQVAPTAAERLWQFRIITIIADVKTAHDRIVTSRRDSRSLQQYRQQEFAPNRIAVYRSAHYTIDSSAQSEAETSLQLIDTLKLIFETPS